MIIKKKIKLLTLCLLLSVSSAAFSTEFWRTGNVERVLVDAVSYGGCMVKISSVISNGCPDNGWVSLDCRHNYFIKSSKNKFALVLTALATNKSISVLVDNTKKNNGYCVAKRVDIIK